MSKISRGFRLNRNLDSSIEDEWTKAFSAELDKATKTAVKTKDEAVSSLFYQINSIVNRKSKYSSVEDAVRDMQERSGYASYLREVQSQNEVASDFNQKTAQLASQNPHANLPDTNNVSDTPTVIKLHPAIKNTLENCIKDTHGFLPIPAIIERIKRIHKNDVSDDKAWNDDDFVRYVGKLNLQEKSNHQQYIPEHNLGKSTEITEDINQANSNFFGGCETQKA